MLRAKHYWRRRIRTERPERMAAVACEAAVGGADGADGAVMVGADSDGVYP